MKTQTITLENFISQGLVCEVTQEEQVSIDGGNFVEHVGYSIGYTAGFFLAAGPTMVFKAATMAATFFNLMAK